VKNIELTEDHESKLLEMCKELFPKYNIDEDETYIDDNGMINYLIETEKDCYDAVEIHWFEFCMTHLCDKIWEIYPKYSKNHIYNGLAMTCNRGVKVKTDLILRALKFHPVDYLYEEFKKLK